MVKTKVIILLVLIAAIPLGAQDFGLKWSKYPIDGSRTGCTTAGADNAAEAMGTVSGDIYYAPNGKVYEGGTAAAVAAAVLAAQPQMADVKQVIGYAPKEMVRALPECELYNFFVDVIMDGVRELSGKQVDVGIVNYGGVRVDMPQGDILLDDIKSMFPFKNTLVYLEQSGEELLKLFRQFARTEVQIVGGAELVISGDELVSAKIGGEPVDPDKMYGVATISFLLYGGDGISLAENAENLEIFPVEIIKVLLERVNELTAAGQPIEYHKDGRVKVL